MVRSCREDRVRRVRFTLSPIGGRGRGGSTSRICCAAPIGRAGRSTTRRSGTSRICPRSWSSWCGRGCAASRSAMLSDAFAIERSLPAGHVNAALAMSTRLELARLLDRSPSRERDLVLAMICQRAIAPASKLATVRAFGQSTVGRGARGRGRRRGRSVRGDGLAAGSSGADRGSPRASASGRRRAGALRRVLLLFRGAVLRAGGAGLLARRQARHPADHLRAVVRQAGPADRGRGVRWRAARRQDAALPDPEAQDTVRAARGWWSSATAGWSPKPTSS